jgi:TRAP-type C4-dicarboxylate transport system permease small subunit
MVIINFLEKRFEEVIAGFGVVLMALMVFFQVVMRYVFSTPVSWSDEIAQYCKLEMWRFSLLERQLEKILISGKNSFETMT